MIGQTTSRSTTVKRCKKIRIGDAVTRDVKPAEVWNVYRSDSEPNKTMLFIPGILTEDVTADQIGTSMRWLRRLPRLRHI